MKLQKLFFILISCFVAACSDSPSPYPIQGIAAPSQEGGYPEQGIGNPQLGISYPQQGIATLEKEDEPSEEESLETQPPKMIEKPFFYETTD